MGRRAIWAGLTGQSLLLDVNALRAREAVSKRKAVEELATQPRWRKSWDGVSLWEGYKRARPHFGEFPPPIAEPSIIPTDKPTIDAPTRDRWMSLFEGAGMSREKAREIVDRLIAIAAAAHMLPYLAQQFDYTDRCRWWRPGRKAARMQDLADQPNPLDWPRLQKGADRSARLIFGELNKGPATIAEIVAATAIKPATVRTFLSLMSQSEEITRVGRGRYALSAEGLARHVPTEQQILNTLADGPATLAMLRARLGKSQTQISRLLRRLKDKIVLVDRGMHALRGTRRPTSMRRTRSTTRSCPAQRPCAN
jgi:DNA-binding transcriptional ArsR family regulator